MKHSGAQSSAPPKSSLSLSLPPPFFFQERHHHRTLQRETERDREGDRETEREERERDGESYEEATSATGELRDYEEERGACRANSLRVKMETGVGTGVGSVVGAKVRRSCMQGGDEAGGPAPLITLLHYLTIAPYS